MAARFIWAMPKEGPGLPRLTKTPLSLLTMNVGVSKNRGTPKSSISIGISIINHPFWGPTLIFGNTNVTEVQSHGLQNGAVLSVFDQHPTERLGLVEMVGIRNMEMFGVVR